MATLRAHTVLDHHASTVWALIVDVGSVASWFPAMSRSESTDYGRTVVLTDGAELDEHTVTMDHLLRRFQYRVRGGDLPIDAHLGTVDVIDIGDGRSLLVYGTEIEPDDVAGAFDAAITEAVHGLDGYLATGATPG